MEKGTGQQKISHYQSKNESSLALSIVLVSERNTGLGKGKCVPTICTAVNCVNVGKFQNGAGFRPQLQNGV